MGLGALAGPAVPGGGVAADRSGAEGRRSQRRHLCQRRDHLGPTVGSGDDVGRGETGIGYVLNENAECGMRKTGPNA